MIYRAYVQGNGGGGRQLEIRAENKWTAIYALEAKGFDVIEIDQASIMSLVADMVLRNTEEA